MSSDSRQSRSASGERACTLTAADIAGITGGELLGDPSAAVDSVAPLSRAQPNNLSFLADGRYTQVLAQSSPGIVLVTPDLAESAAAVPARIVVEKPPAALLQLLPKFYPERQAAPSIHHTATIGRNASIGEGVTLGEYAVIGEGASIGDDVSIGAHAVVGDGVSVGRRSRIFPHVTLYPGTTLGERVILHAGVRVGSDGFGYVFTGTEHSKIPHVGRCVIGNDVEVGANTTIDRGSIDDTMIGDGTKIDNLVQIGHNVQVGSRCLIMAQVGIAGSARIGDGVVIAGQAGLGGHITIGAGARIGGQSGVFGNVPAGEVWSGYPARPHRESLRATGALFKLPDFMKRIERFLDEREGK